MNDRLPSKRAYVLVLTVLLHSVLSCCTLEIFDNAFSAPDVSNDFAEDQRVNPGPSIEQIFLGPKERRSSVSEPKQIPEDASKASRRSVGGEKLVRAKRESPSKKSDQKNLKEGAKAAEKRSVASKAASRASRASKSSLRADRPSRESSRQASKVSDYDAGLEDRADYDEFEEDAAVRGSDYKSNELKLTEDRFIDQDERSMLYDDFETKDVVKRGVAEDYEELDDEVDDAEDSLEERGTLEEDAGRRKVHSEARVKREHASKKREISAPSKTSESALKDQSVKDSGLVDDQAGKKESQIAEEQPGKAEKEAKVNEEQSKLDQSSNDQTDQAKRNIATDPQIDVFKVAAGADSKQCSLSNDQVQIGGAATTEEEKKKEEAGLSIDKKTADEPPDLNGVAKLDDAKVDVLTSDAAKIETPAGNAEVGASEDAGKPENLNLDVPTGVQSDKEYEKRVEEQIQRKIDSIKEEIKREIAESEKLKEIESNNAKFDEILDQEEDEEEQLVAEKKENPAKRSASSLEKKASSNGEKRLVKRRKRQNESNQENMKTSNDMNTKVEKKSAQTVRKRSVAPSQLMQPLNTVPLKKRDVMRTAYLVRRDRGKKRRRRRSRDSEQGSLREDLKSQSSELAQDERTLAEVAAPLDSKSDSVASLTGNAEELGPLASEYGEAFGGLQGESGIALARFKRIKRVLRPQASKSPRGSK